MLRRILGDLLTADEHAEMISAFDQIGGIIIVRIPDALLPKRRLIGEALLGEVKAARSVFYQTSAVDGDHRVRSLQLLAGEDSTVTEYREFGCRFMVDVAGAFFSPRLSTERDRIASMTGDGEVVTNMFGGVGMFSILCARRSRCTVYSIDVNPVASRLCRHNARINRTPGRVISINGDASDIISDRLVDMSDRTLMLLPERSDEFLHDAVRATRSGGIIHYYSHIHADKKADAGRLSEAHYTEVAPVRSEILGSRIVRAVGPRYYQTVVDVMITK